MLAVIPSIPSRKVPIPHDANLYKNRNRIERCFNKPNTSGASQHASTEELPIS